MKLVCLVKLDLLCDCREKPPVCDIVADVHVLYRSNLCTREDDWSCQECLCHAERGALACATYKTPQQERIVSCRKFSLNENHIRSTWKSDNKESRRTANCSCVKGVTKITCAQ